MSLRLVAIAAALRIVAPHWHAVVDTSVELERLERRYHVPAELIIVTVKHESAWREDVVNPLSGTAGLMQIDPFNFQGCGSSGSRWTDVCWHARSRLYDWRFNLQTGTRYFAFARGYCAERGRGVAPETWLQLPTGFDAVRGSRCGWKRGHRLPVPKMVVDLLRAAASLRHAVARTDH